jgi:hypothetical protein
MKAVGHEQLLTIPEVARRLDVSDDVAFDLAFVSRDLPLEFTDGDHGVPERAVESYLEAHAGQQ